MLCSHHVGIPPKETSAAPNSSPPRQNKHHPQTLPQTTTRATPNPLRGKSMTRLESTSSSSVHRPPWKRRAAARLHARKGTLKQNPSHDNNKLTRNRADRLTQRKGLHEQYHRVPRLIHTPIYLEQPAARVLCTTKLEPPKQSRARS